MDQVEQIKRLREGGMSLFEAKKTVEREAILRAIDEARDFYTLRALVRRIAEKVL